MTQVDNLASQLQQLETSLGTVRNVDQAVKDKLKAVRDKLGEIQKIYYRTPEGQTQYRQLYFNALRGGTVGEVAMRAGSDISRFPGAPTQMSITKIEEAKAFLAPLIEKMKEITDKDVPELNKLLAEKKIPYIK
jgi:hypothetical protein